MRTPSVPCFAAGCLVALLTAATPAVAQDEAAALWDRGLADMKAGRYDTGCPALAESYHLDPRPETLFTLAECEAKGERLATAVARYDEYLSILNGMPAAEQQKRRHQENVARTQRAALTPQVPELKLVAPPGFSAGTAVKRDGAVLAESALGASLQVDAGMHVITTQAPGGGLTEQHVTVANGEKKQILLEVKPPPSSAQPLAAPTVLSAPQPTAPPPDTSSAHRTAGWVVGGVGVAVVAVGAVAAGFALGKRGAINQNCTGLPNGTLLCNVAGENAAHSVHTAGLVTSIGLGVGLAAVSTGVVLLLTAPSRPKASSAGPRMWLRASVLAVGPEGAVLGVRGGF